MLVSAVNIRTDPSCVAVYKSSIPCLSENVSTNFRIISLHLLAKNCSTKK